MTLQIAELNSDVIAKVKYRPKTPFAKRLMAIRERAIASGMKLLSWEELEVELQERRGERLKNSDDSYIS
ncbi:MAG: hypothetical protein P9X24_07795 [Candidatus Hatepunaea meridiana]|nr:hypothetical protein [Candidatus Hatepunaea meridiana]